MIFTAVIQALYESLEFYGHNHAPATRSIRSIMIFTAANNKAMVAATIAGFKCWGMPDMAGLASTRRRARLHSDADIRVAHPSRASESRTRAR